MGSIASSPRSEAPEGRYHRAHGVSRGFRRVVTTLWSPGGATLRLPRRKPVSPFQGSKKTEVMT